MGSPGDKKGLGERKGSVVDTFRMRKVWESLGYLVYEHIDLRKREIEERVTDMLKRKEKLGCAKSFGITFMSHGDENYQIAAFDEVFNYMPLVDEINKSPELKGKPKLVFINGTIIFLILLYKFFLSMSWRKIYEKSCKCDPSNNT